MNIRMGYGTDSLVKSATCVGTPQVFLKFLRKPKCKKEKGKEKKRKRKRKKKKV